MKVADIRTKLKAFPQDDMIELFIAAYKVLPKEKKEGIIDELILHGIHAKMGKPKAKATPQTDFPALAEEIKRFLKNAYAQNYVAPNRIIPKTQRSKWRFLFMRFLKELRAIPVGDPHFREANDLLVQLFQLISYACAYYTFHTENPFPAIKISQGALYEHVVSRLLAESPSDEDIKKALQMALESHLDYDTGMEDLYQQLLQLLDTTDLQRRTLEQTQLLAKEYEKQPASYRKEMRLDACEKIIAQLKTDSAK